MGKCTEGKSKAPGCAVTPVKVNSEGSNQDKEKKRMAKYPAVAERFPEKEMPCRFIDDVGQKRPDEESPDVDTSSQ